MEQAARRMLFGNRVETLIEGLLHFVLGILRRLNLFGDVLVDERAEERRRRRWSVR